MTAVPLGPLTIVRLDRAVASGVAMAMSPKIAAMLREASNDKRIVVSYW
jgi:hypothetical protein